MENKLREQLPPDPVAACLECNVVWITLNCVAKGKEKGLKSQYI